MDRETSSDMAVPRSLSLPSALLLVIALIPVGLLPSLPALRRGDIATVSREVNGGWNWSALLYAIWNEASLLIIGPALLDHFARRHNAPTKSRLFRPEYSYATFVIHTLVSVCLEVGVDWLVLTATGPGLSWLDSPAWKAVGPLVMTGIMSGVNIVASFAVGKFLVEYVPGLRRIL